MIHRTSNTFKLNSIHSEGRFESDHLFTPRRLLGGLGSAVREPKNDHRQHVSGVVIYMGHIGNRHAMFKRRPIRSLVLSQIRPKFPARAPST